MDLELNFDSIKVLSWHDARIIRLRGLVGYDVGLISSLMMILVTELPSEGLQFEPGRGHLLFAFGAVGGNLPIRAHSSTMRR